MISTPALLASVLLLTTIRCGAKVAGRPGANRQPVGKTAGVRGGMYGAPPAAAPCTLPVAGAAVRHPNGASTSAPRVRATRIRRVVM